MPLDSKRKRTRTKQVTTTGGVKSGRKKKTITKPGATRSRTVTYSKNPNTGLQDKIVTRSRQRTGENRSVDKTKVKVKKGGGRPSKTITDKKVTRNRATGGDKVKTVRKNRTKGSSSFSKTTNVKRNTPKGKSQTVRSRGRNQKNTRYRKKG
jgi:hypothetical protein